MLYWSIQKFYDAGCSVIVVLPEGYRTHWDKVCSQHNITVPHKITKGGKSRTESVKNGLLEISDIKALVAIHDAARPFVSASLIEKVFNAAEKKGNCVPLIPMTDSIRKVKNDASEFRNRSEYRIVQTPQVFMLDSLQKAYTLHSLSEFSDDASLMESQGHTIFSCEGEPTNIKITRPEDLGYAEFLLEYLN